MAKLTREQLQLDCELVLAVYGKEYCRQIWFSRELEKVRTYEEACAYFAGSLFAPMKWSDAVVSWASDLRGDGNEQTNC